MTALTDKVRSRGFWDIVIRPEDFVPERLQYECLYSVLEGVVVRFRGWPVPMIDRRYPFLQGDDWIGEDIDAHLVSHYEAWRFFTSGQFNHLRAVSADWREGREATHGFAGFTDVIEVWEILFYLTEIFELAARLALSNAGGDRMVVEAKLSGLKGRGLVVGEPNRMEFDIPHATSLPEISRAMTMDRHRLVANPRHEAVTMAHQFFVRFGWNPPIDQLKEHQRELTDRR